MITESDYVNNKLSEPLLDGIRALWYVSYKDADEWKTARFPTWDEAQVFYKQKLDLYQYWYRSNATKFR